MYILETKPLYNSGIVSVRALCNAVMSGNTSVYQQDHP